MTESVRVAVAAAIKCNPAGLKAEAIAARMRVHASVLYRWGELGGKPIPTDRLVQFCLITGDSRPIAALCREVGGTFLPLPAQGSSDKDLVRSIKEFSDLAQAVSAAKVDGQVSEDELVRIRREGAEAQRAIAQLLGALEAEAAK